MAKQFALENSLGEAARVDGDHRLRGARREGVKRLGGHFLARAVLARDEDVRVRRPHARDQLAHGLHGPRLGDQLGAPFGAQQAVLRLQAQASPQGLAQLDLSAKDGDEPRVFPRLLDEVARAPPHRLDGQLDAAPRRHHHHGQGVVQGLEARQQVQPLFAGRGVAGVVEVHKQTIEVPRLNRREYRRRRGDSLDLVSLSLEQQSKRLQHVTLVVSDQDPGRAGVRLHRLAICPWSLVLRPLSLS